MLSKKTALNKLIESGIEFTINEFKQSISRPRIDELFHLFIQAGITEKIKNYDSLLKYCFQRGSAEKARVLLAHLRIDKLSQEVFYELIDRAAFEHYDVPDSFGALQWKTLVIDCLSKAEGVNFVKISNFHLSNHHRSEEQSCLRLSVSMKDHQLVKFLVDTGALVNFQFFKDSFLLGGNLLHLISAQQKIADADVTITNILIQAGIKIDLRDSNNHTPLALCAMSGAIEIAHILVDQGACIDEKIGPNEDSTILMYSITHKSYAIAKLLLDRGADVHHRDRNGWTAARLAFIRHNREIGEAIITKGAVLRPFIGLSGRSCEKGGILIEMLDNTASGSAYSAGIRRNDTLVAADFRPINSMPDLIEIICSKRPLETITITVVRGDTMLDFEVEIQVI